VPLNRMIGMLCQIAEDTGIPGEVTRKEMVAAIIYDITEAGGFEPDRLVTMLQAYRTAMAQSRMPEESQEIGYFDYDEPRPGRPKRS
jgi:hypothetical protein